MVQNKMPTPWSGLDGAMFGWLLACFVVSSVQVMSDMTWLCYLLVVEGLPSAESNLLLAHVVMC